MNGLCTKLFDSQYVDADHTFLRRCVAGADGVASAWLIWTTVTWLFFFDVTYIFFLLLSALEVFFLYLRHVIVFLSNDNNSDILLMFKHHINRRFPLLSKNVFADCTD